MSAAGFNDVAKKFYEQATAGTLPANPSVATGAAADNAAASGNPVLVAGQYESTPSTYANGDVSNIHVDSRGNVRATLFSNNTATAIAASTAQAGLATSNMGLYTMSHNYVFDGAAMQRMPGDAVGTFVKSPSYNASVTFTPAAASHTAGDANGAVGEFTSIGPSAGRIRINSASIRIDGGTAEATAWRLYLFNVTPPSALADDAAFTLASGDRASFLGFVDIGTAVDIGDTQWTETHGIDKYIILSGTSVFGYLVNLTTLTPAAVAHVVTLHTTGV